METNQDSFQFPSVQIQEVVNKLWDKIHEVSGTMNFLIERNNELKKKLELKSQTDSHDSNGSDEYMKRIEGLELEIGEYLKHIFNLETKLKELRSKNSELITVELNYLNVIASYDKLKKSVNQVNFPEDDKMLKENLKQVDQLVETIEYLRDEVALKNKQLTKTNEELLRVNRELQESRDHAVETGKFQIEIDNLKKELSEIDESRAALKDEADILRTELLLKESQQKEKEVSLTKEISSLNEIYQSSLNENKNLKLRINELSDESLRSSDELRNENHNLKNHIDTLSMQIADTDNLINSISEKDEFIEKLTEQMQSLTGEKNDLLKKVDETQTELESNKADYEFARHRISELNSEVVKLESELKSREHAVSPAVEADIEVKEMMLKEFAEKEKELVARIQAIEAELEEKNKIISNNRDADLILEDRLLSLEKLLKEKENAINELNKNIQAAGNKHNGYEQKIADIANRLAARENELKEMIVENKHLKRESDSKTSNIRTLESQLENCRVKLSDIEMSMIKTDSKISIDEAIRTDLIANLEKQLAKIELMIGK